MGAKGQRLTATQRAKISAARKRYLASLPAPVADSTHKRCSKCGTTKPLSEFHWSTRKPKGRQATRRPESACKVCKLAQNKETRERERREGRDAYARWTQWWERKRAEDPAYYQQFLAKKREREVTLRREQGARPMPGHYRKRLAAEGERLPAGPLVDLLNQELNASSPRLLAEQSGVDQRRIYGLLHGEYEQVSLSVVDRLLHGLGLPHMLPILYPEEP